MFPLTAIYDKFRFRCRVAIVTSCPQTAHLPDAFMQHAVTAALLSLTLSALPPVTYLPTLLYAFTYKLSQTEIFVAHFIEMIANTACDCSNGHLLKLIRNFILADVFAGIITQNIVRTGLQIILSLSHW